MGDELFHASILSYNLPRLTGILINLSSIGIITSAVLSIGLLPSRPGTMKPRAYIFHLLQWILMPFAFIIWGSVPALEAQTRMMLGGRFRLGFWKTPKAAEGTV